MPAKYEWKKVSKDAVRLNRCDFGSIHINRVESNGEDAWTVTLVIDGHASIHARYRTLEEAKELSIQCAVNQLDALQTFFASCADHLRKVA